jgi:hypothetical protein
VRCIRNVERSELALYIPQLLQDVKAKDTDGLSEILVGNANEDDPAITALRDRRDLESPWPEVPPQKQNGASALTAQSPQWRPLVRFLRRGGIPGYFLTFRSSLRISMENNLRLWSNMREKVEMLLGSAIISNGVFEQKFIVMTR